MSTSTGPSEAPQAPAIPLIFRHQLLQPAAFALFVMVACLVPIGQVGAEERWHDFGLFDSRPGSLRIEAQRLGARGENGPILLTGGVHVTGGDLDIRAEWMEIFPEQERVVMAGAVRMIEGRAVLLGQRLEIDQDTGSAIIENAVIVIKEGVSSESLPGKKTARCLLDAGYNAFTLEGRRITRADEAYEVEGARFTACDCGPDEEPSWEIGAVHADVVPDERAWLRWPVLYLKGIPVFVSPIAYLPLSRRRTGLLFPQVNYSGRDGFVLSESLFVTLGSSADTTLSVDWFEERGFRERLEFRARPTSNSGLEARLMYLYDQKFASDEVRKNLQHRYSAEVDAWALGSQGTSLAAEVRLYSDSDINRNFQSEMAGRATDYAPSALVIAQRGDDWLLAAEAVYRQDLRFGAVDLLGAQRGEALKRQTHDTIQRLGALTFNLAPSGFGDFPLLASFFAEGANLSSLSAAWRDWGVDGTPDDKEPRYSDPLDDVSADGIDFGADNMEGGEGDGSYGSSELRRAFRFLFEPRVSLPYVFGNYMTVEAGLSHRQLVYLPHGPGRPQESTRGISFADLELATELSRSFGETGDLGHVVRPWLRLAGAWRGLQYGGQTIYLDVHDRLLVDAQQMLLGLSNSLFGREKSGGFERLLGIDLLQGFDLAAGRLAQAALDMKLHLSPFDGHLCLAYDWEKLALAEVDTLFRFADKRGDRVSVSYIYLPSVRDASARPLPLSQRIQREEGLLFGPDRSYYRALGESIHVIQASVTAEIAWGLGLSAGANLDLQAGELAWYGGGMHYDSNCRCWGFSLTLRMLRGQDYPDVFFLLDLAYLGAAGVGTNTRF